MELIIVIVIFFILALVESKLRDLDSSFSNKKVRSTHKYPDVVSLRERVSKQQPNLQPMFMSAQAKKTYLQSMEWKSLRAIALLSANSQCEHCGSTHRLEAHHTSYLHLGQANANELADLAILCRRCHGKLHDKLGYDRTTEYPISILKD